MTEKELKRAMQTCRPVQHHGITYRRITAVVSLPDYKSGGVVISADLECSCDHSTTRALGREVQLAGVAITAGCPNKTTEFAGMCAHCMQPISIGQEMRFRPAGKLFHISCVEDNPEGSRILVEKREAIRERNRRLA